MLDRIKRDLTAYLLTQRPRRQCPFLTTHSFILLVSTITACAQGDLVASSLWMQRPAGGDAEVRALEPGRPVERALAGGEAHSYGLALAAGRFCHAVVDQRGIDVVVALYGPGGEKIVEVDNPNYRNGPEQVSLIAATSGSYRLEVRSLEKNAPAGRYEVKIEILREATRQDESRVAAQRAFTEAKSMRNLRTAESRRRAIEKYQEALSLWQTLNDRRMMAYSLHEMGLIYDFLGEYQKALDAYSKARLTYKSLGDLRGQASVLSNLGVVYGALGEYQRAIDITGQGLEAYRAAGDRHYEPRLLSNIGTYYADLKDYRKALGIHLRVLEIRRARDDRAGQAITLNNIANCYGHLGDRQKALDHYGRALEFMPYVGDSYYTATTLNHVGALYRDLREHEKALDHFSQALQLRRAIGDLRGEAATLANIARLERDRGNMAEARNRIEAALAAVESLRANVASQQLRASFFATVRQYHELYIDLLMRLHKRHPADGFDAAALQASEKARARSLLELLTEARAGIRQGVDPTLIERERALRQMISDKAESQVRLLRGNHTEAQAAAATREIDALTAEYEQVQSQIRGTSPRYAALTQPVPLGLGEIQTRVLDDDTLLLEYALCEERSYLWAVSPAWIKSYELPKRAEIEPLARRFHELLRGGALRRRGEIERAAHQLGRMLLGPVASELKNRRLLVVGDGVLQYVPFAALASPSAADSRPLVSDNEIVSLPSASVVAVLRQETADRKPAGKTLAVLADPVFSRDDPRVLLAGEGRVAESGASPAETDAKRSAGESGLADLLRLRFSRQEADQIARLVPDEMKLHAVDFAASRRLATSEEIGRYRIVHFATHGLVNNAHPELSGVVLSLVDEQGRPQNGFLRLYDIYNLRLAADLVVLSACQTALGREIQGEGIVGLTRGFMYAGAPRVVASLWRVEDRATAVFMRRFYGAMMAEGLPPAAALRAAQVSMSREKRWQAPYYWAGFTLQGEWK